MTDLLEKALEAVRKLPAEDQDDIARAILDLMNVEGVEQIDPEHLEGVLEGLAQADRGEFATSAEIEDVLHRFRPLKIDPRDLAAVLEGFDQIRRGEFATEEEVEDAYRHFGS
jgi:predicted transcriptional regulator